MRTPKIRPVEMRTPEVDPFEVRLLEIGPFEMRSLEIGPSQNGTAKIETPSVGALALPAPPTPPLDHRQGGGDIRCRWLAEFILLDGFSPKLVGASVWPAHLPP